jgi:hypothetical protein
MSKIGRFDGLCFSSVGPNAARASAYTGYYGCKQLPRSWCLLIARAETPDRRVATKRMRPSCDGSQLDHRHADWSVALGLERFS